MKGTGVVFYTHWESNRLMLDVFHTFKQHNSDYVVFMN